MSELHGPGVLDLARALAAKTVSPVEAGEACPEAASVRG